MIEDSAEAAHTTYVRPFLALGVSVCGPPLLHIPRMYTNTSFYARFDVHTSPKRAYYDVLPEVCTTKVLYKADFLYIRGMCIVWKRRFVVRAEEWTGPFGP